MTIGTCIVCGKEIVTPHREVPIYCDEHRAYTKLDDKIIREAPMERLYILIYAIFIRARIDYMTDADGQAKDAEEFLRSDWAQKLSLSSYDAEELIQRLDEEAEYGFDYNIECPF